MFVEYWWWKPDIGEVLRRDYSAATLHLGCNHTDAFYTDAHKYFLNFRIYTDAISPINSNNGN